MAAFCQVFKGAGPVAYGAGVPHGLDERIFRYLLVGEEAALDAQDELVERHGRGVS